MRIVDLMESNQTRLLQDFVEMGVQGTCPDTCEPRRLVWHWLVFHLKVNDGLAVKYASSGTARCCTGLTRSQFSRGRHCLTWDVQLSLADCESC